MSSRSISLIISTNVIKDSSEENIELMFESVMFVFMAIIVWFTVAKVLPCCAIL